jgi:hypothetical protein
MLATSKVLETFEVSALWASTRPAKTSKVLETFEVSALKATM